MAAFSAALAAPVKTDWLMVVEADFLLAHDFLTPEAGLFDPAKYRMPAYCRRANGFLQYSKGGGWFIFWNPKGAPVPDLSPTGEHNDPGNGIDAQEARLLFGEDDFPAVHYDQIGSHLFFSRHYNDPPETPLVGVDSEYPQTVGEMLQAHDRLVDAYEQQLEEEER